MSNQELQKTVADLRKKKHSFDEIVSILNTQKKFTSTGKRWTKANLEYVFRGRNKPSKPKRRIVSIATTKKTHRRAAVTRKPGELPPGFVARRNGRSPAASLRTEHDALEGAVNRFIRELTAAGQSISRLDVGPDGQISVTRTVTEIIRL